MRIASTIGATAVEHDGETYEADDKGIFDVPQHVGEELTKFGHWVEEHVAEAADAAEKLAHDLDPVEINDRLTDIEETAEKVVKQLADALDRLSKLEKAAADKPAPTKAPAKKAAPAAAK